MHFQFKELVEQIPFFGKNYFPFILKKRTFNGFRLANRTNSNLSNIQSNQEIKIIILRHKNKHKMEDIETKLIQ